MSRLRCQFADSTPRFGTLRAEPSTWLTTRQNRHDMEADSRMRKCNMCEAAACPFLAPHFGALSEVLCEDGKYVKAGRACFEPVEMPRVLEGTSLQDWSCMKGGHGQRAQCPANSPVMCARQSCHDLRAKNQPKSKSPSKVGSQAVRTKRTTAVAPRAISLMARAHALRLGRRLSNAAS